MTTQPARLIGPAARVRAVLLSRVVRLLAGDWSAKKPFLLWGPRGTGKTTVAGEVALTLAGHKTNIERINGQELTVDRLKDWLRAMPCAPLSGGFDVKFVDEADQCSVPAMGMLRTFLNDGDMPKFTCFIATTNKTPSELPMIQSRFYDREVPPPCVAEIRTHLINHPFNLPDDVANEYAEQCEGDVREAINQAEKWKDENEIETILQPAHVQGTQVRRAVRLPVGA
jgi:DNA polymerase III delta prime subunit